MSLYNIQLDALEPEPNNTKHTAALLRNAMLMRLDTHVKKQALPPSWVIKLVDKQWRGVVMNPHLVYLITRKPMGFSWEELESILKNNRTQSFPLVEHRIPHYNDQSAEPFRARPWARDDARVDVAIEQTLALLRESNPQAFVLVTTLVT